MTDTDTDDREWLRANQRGSFAMGTVSRVPERKYHGLLVVRDAGFPEPLHVLLEVGERVETPAGRFELGGFRYEQGIFPAGRVAALRFEARPRPRWTYELGGLVLTREVAFDPEIDSVAVIYRVSGDARGARLFARPFLTCRPLHGLTRENPFLDGRMTIRPTRVTMRLYPALPEVELLTLPPARYLEAGTWNRGIHYARERRRGYDHVEDAYCPGQFLIELETTPEFELRVGMPKVSPEPVPELEHPACFQEWLDHAARRFLIRRPDGRRTVIAGYPWFGEWGRDAAIALPGLTLARGDVATAHELLDGLGAARLDGLVPNLLPGRGGPGDPHSVDASLWTVRAVQALGEAAGLAAADRHWPLVREILERLRRPTPIGTRLTERGELFADGGDRPLTWMDARVGGRPVTPRAPFAVEIQGLWHNALACGARLARRAGERELSREYKLLAGRLKEAFLERFWLPEEGWLADAHDGRAPDRALRPNQLVATGLPESPVQRRIARRVLEAVERELLTPVGLRTLSPRHPDYRGRCQGGPEERDRAYHQGTVWPWLLGPYGDTLVRVWGASRAAARLRELLPALERHCLEEGCLGWVSEILDGDPPHTPRGAPAQAWSVAEVLRLAKLAGYGEPPGGGRRQASGPRLFRPPDEGGGTAP